MKVIAIGAIAINAERRQITIVSQMAGDTPLPCPVPNSRKDGVTL